MSLRKLVKKEDMTKIETQFAANKDQKNVKISSQSNFDDNFGEKNI